MFGLGVSTIVEIIECKFNLVEIETNVSKLFQYETTQTHVLYSTSFGLGLWKPTPLVKNVRTYTSADQPQVSVGILTPLPSSGIQNVAVPCCEGFFG